VQPAAGDTAVLNRRTRTALLLATAALGVGIAAWTGRGHTDARPSTPAVAAPAAVIELAPTDLAQAERRELRRAIPITGSLQARNQTVVKAKIAGEIRELLVREGEPVRAGQVVARIDATEAETRVAEKAADLEAARAQAQLAEKTRRNQERLLEQNYISQNAYDNAVSSSLVAEAKLKAAGAQLALARKALDDTVVRAPLAGVVAQRLAQPGERVPVDGKILALVDLAELEVEAAIPASDIPGVRIGQDVAFVIEGYEDRRFTGRIDRIAPSAIAGSRSIMVYAVVPNADGALRSGMFAKGHVTIGRRDALVLPIGAVREDAEGALVYAVDEGVLAKRRVEPGVRDESQGIVEVLSGLEPGVAVVKVNLGTLREGARVQVAGERK
jgi:RND family efflux transporter MFP subunit